MPSGPFTVNRQPPYIAASPRWKEDACHVKAHIAGVSLLPSFPFRRDRYRHLHRMPRNVVSGHAMSSSLQLVRTECSTPALCVNNPLFLKHGGVFAIIGVSWSIGSPFSVFTPKRSAGALFPEIAPPMILTEIVEHKRQEVASEEEHLRDVEGSSSCSPLAISPARARPA